MNHKNEIELSFVMPCLNEAETLQSCIQTAHQGAKSAGVDHFEIIIADNGSTDGSQDIGRAEGAKVIDVPQKGYGSALRAGIQASRGTYVIMGDSDLSYDFSNLGSIIEQLRKGFDLVMGSRLKGEILSDAMPFLHRYLGNPILTALGNLFFGAGLSDFHCGLRGFKRDAILSLNLSTTGMEYASEMVIRATLSNLSITEVPISYYPDGRSRPPHLRTWHDGWRHLRFMLLFSPRWVFIYPGIFLIGIGGLASLLLITGPKIIAGVVFDVHTLLIFATIIVIGFQLLLMGIFARTYAARAGLLPHHEKLENWIEKFSLGAGLLAGILIAGIGILLYAYGFVIWSDTAFGPLFDYQNTLRVIISGTTLLILGTQLFFGSFVISLIGLQ